MLGAAASAVNWVPGFEPAGAFWRAPILALAAGSPAVFWLWARVIFDDDFILRGRHAALWALLVAGEMVSAYGGATWSRLGPVADTMVQLASLGLAVLAAAQTMATWRGDLVMGRRRLRVAVMLGAVLFISIDAIYSSGLGRLALAPAAIDTFRAAGLCVLAVLTAWSLLQVAPTGPAAAVLPQSRADAPPAAEPKTALQTIAPSLLRRLEQLMTEECIFRQERLTIGALASRLTVPEEQLRRAINEGLGYRNFNAFINQYRLKDVKTALSDPSQHDVPVLTIAMDAGFRSLGPFNRAFKADTGMTPTEYRRKARGAPPADLSRSDQADRKIG
ncbi:helix-turn-helix domain-containing protein [Bradyrhizobium iriomotense]|nr:AraC family transcriptional regulator [Bradyrhizobium iriomotense]